MTPDEYLKERVEDQIKWYDTKSKSNKQYFYAARILETLLAISIPILTLFVSDNPKVGVAIAIVGGCITLITLTLSLGKFQERWIEYRTTCESLRKHKYRFVTRTMPYHHKDIQESFGEFVNNIEATVSQENTNWAQYIQSTDKEEVKK